MENETPKKNNTAKVVISIILSIIIIWFIFGGGEVKLASQQLNEIQNKVAQDAVDQYEIAKRQGDKMQIYTQASLVAAAYLQAKDEPNYNKWKLIQDSCGKVVGLNK
ncbi:hypothetical protein [Mucilaginibacter sp. SP1R1]|uniref:hypothetical protein n=1 Tax=Mucilaginibacter sp. SP1R1 TaxID=2723091 RepID=UPI0016183F78|nr:hypothetical protein [Mucilaginibacter sp. SP1R1]MBB6149471.1 hypothetical protein [Mucilaginibacter sp. SP1R1]